MGLDASFFDGYFLGYNIWQFACKLHIVSSLVVGLLQIERSPCIMTDCRYSWKELYVKIYARKYGEERKVYIRQPNVWMSSSKVNSLLNYFKIYHLFVYIDKIQQYETVCRYLFTANILYMFRVRIAVTVWCTSDDWCDVHLKHVEHICSK